MVNASVIKLSTREGLSFARGCATSPGPPATRQTLIAAPRGYGTGGDGGGAGANGAFNPCSSNGISAVAGMRAPRI